MGMKTWRSASIVIVNSVDGALMMIRCEFAVVSPSINDSEYCTGRNIEERRAQIVSF
jgi:hypothetical protein